MSGQVNRIAIVLFSLTLVIWIGWFIASVRERRKRPTELSCSFCGKQKKETDHLIGGPNVLICEDCIANCNRLLEEQRSEARR